MKKYLLFVSLVLLAVFTIFFLMKMEENNNNESLKNLPVEGEWERINFIENNNGVLYKYDLLLKDKIIEMTSYTSLCKEPLCTHENYFVGLSGDFNKDLMCKFSGCSSEITRGDQTYFIKYINCIDPGTGDITDRISLICVYNYVTEEYNAFENSTNCNIYPILEYYDCNIFFYIEAADQTLNPNSYELIKINFNTWELESLFTVSEVSESNFHDFMIKDELIFFDNENKTILKTDIYFQKQIDLTKNPRFESESESKSNGIIYPLIDDGDFLYYTYIQDKSDTDAQCELYRVDIKTGRTSHISEPTGLFISPQIINGFLYYLSDLYGNKIYRIRLDGIKRKPEIYYDFEAENMSISDIKAVRAINDYLIVSVRDNPAEKIVLDIKKER